MAGLSEGIWRLALSLGPSCAAAELSPESAGSPIYSASKAAVIALAKSVALEFAPKGIRVNAVCAAIIETDMTGKLRSDEETRRALLERHPLGRFGTSEEVAAAVLYLCSPEAAFLTGVALPIDGGWGL